MNLKKDITTFADIQCLVNAFYDKVRQDELVAPIFNQAIQSQWPEHLEKMHRFWETVLMKHYTYSGVPFPPHAKLPVQHIHFEKWLALFTETTDAHFEGAKTEEAKWRAGKMAMMFESKINYIPQHP